MQNPQQPFVPPKGFSSPPRGDLAKWMWAVLGFGLTLLAVVVFVKLRENSASEPAPKTEAALPVHLQADEVSMDVAAGWAVFDRKSKQFSSELEEAIVKTPALKEWKQTAIDYATKMNYKLYVLHPPSSAKFDDMASICLSTGPFFNRELADVVTANEMGWTRSLGHAPARSKGELAGLPAEILEAEVPMQMGSGQVMFNQEEYFVTKANIFYLLAVTVPKGRESTIEVDAERMVRTMQVDVAGID